MNETKRKNLAILTDLNLYSSLFPTSVPKHTQTQPCKVVVALKTSSVPLFLNITKRKLPRLSYLPIHSECKVRIPCEFGTHQLDSLLASQQLPSHSSPQLTNLKTRSSPTTQHVSLRALSCSQRKGGAGPGTITDRNRSPAERAVKYPLGKHEVHLSQTTSE